MSRFAFFALLIASILTTIPAYGQSMGREWFFWGILENDFNIHELGTGVLQHETNEELTITYRLTRGDDWSLYVLKNPDLCHWVAQYHMGNGGLNRQEACDLYVAYQVSSYEYQHDDLYDAVLNWINSRRDLHDEKSLFRDNDVPDPEFFTQEDLQVRQEQAVKTTGSIHIQANVETQVTLRHNDELLMGPTILPSGNNRIHPISPGVYVLNVNGSTRDIEIKAGQTVDVQYTEDEVLLLLGSDDQDGDGVINDKDECPKHPNPCPEVYTGPERTLFGEAWSVVGPQVNPLHQDTFVAGPVLGYRYTQGDYSVKPNSEYRSAQDTGLLGVEVAFNRYRFQVAGFGGFDVAMPDRPFFYGFQVQGGLDLTYARLGYGWLFEQQGSDPSVGYAYVHDGFYWTVEVSPWSIPERLRWTEIFRLGYGSCQARGWMPVQGASIGWRETKYPLIYFQVNIASKALFDLR